MRRALAVFLAVVLIVLFIPGLFVLRVNATAGNPGFYAEQLRRADVYNFVHTDVLPAALDGAGATVSWAKPLVLTISKQILPSDWLQAQTEQVIYAVVPYVVGDVQGFTVTVPVKDRIEASGRGVKETLHKEGVFPPIYDQMAGFLGDAVSASLQGSPLPVTANDVKAIVRTAFPADWVLKQVDSAIDEVTPYLSGDKAQFTVRVNIPERVPFISAAFADIMRRPEAYDYVVREVMVRLVKQAMQNAQLPAGVTLTDAEITTLVRQVMPLDWYQARVPEIVGQIFAYLGGSQPNLAITIAIADRKAALADGLARLADQKLERAWDALPACTPAQIAGMLLNPPTDRLPPCRPLNMSYADIKRVVRIDFTAMLVQPFVRTLPDRLTLSEAMLGGTGPSSPLVQARAALSRELTFTDAQLRAMLGANQTLLDTVRQSAATGLTFTDREMRSLMGSGAQDFDGVRRTIGTLRRMAWLVWPVLLLLAAGAGMLAGRRWSTRLICAAAVLGIGAVVALIVFGPVFSATVQSVIDQAMSQMSGGSDKLQALVAGKAAAIVQNSVSSFIGGLRAQSVVLLIVAAALAAAGVVWGKKLAAKG